VKRILRDDGVCWVNLGDSRGGSNGNGYKQTMDAVNRTTGEAGNINLRRLIGRKDSVKAKSLCLVPERFAIAMEEDGWYVRSRICWRKISSMPESASDRPTESHETIWMLTKSSDYYYDRMAVRQANAEGGANLRNTWVDLDSGDMEDLWSLGPEPFSMSIKTSERVRVLVDDVDDDTERIESPDCPVHAHPQPSMVEYGGLPTDSRTRMLCIESHLVQVPQGGHAPIPDLFLEQLSQQLTVSPVATGRSNPSSKTALHSETNPPYTVCEGKTVHTGGNLAQHDDGSRRPDICESSTAAGSLTDETANRPSDRMIGDNIGTRPTADKTQPYHAFVSPGAEPHTSVNSSARRVEGDSSDMTDGTIRKSSCTCSYYKTIIQETSHFATYPSSLVKRCVLLTTSEKGACSQCGKPWKRILESRPSGKDWNRASDFGHSRIEAGNTYSQPAKGYTPPSTLGWEPGCTCGADVTPCTVMDIFMGSGTTAMVAHRLGRRFLGTEGSAEYIAIAKERIDADRLPIVDQAIQAQETETIAAFEPTQLGFLE